MAENDNKDIFTCNFQKIIETAHLYHHLNHPQLVAVVDGKLFSTLG
jgi:hypothetical protein